MTLGSKWIKPKQKHSVQDASVDEEWASRNRGGGHIMWGRVENRNRKEVAFPLLSDTVDSEVSVLGYVTLVNTGVWDMCV